MTALKPDTITYFVFQEIPILNTQTLSLFEASMDGCLIHCN